MSESVAASVAARYQLNQINSRPLPTFILDSGVLADRLIVPTVPEFDYPRSDLLLTSAMSGRCTRRRREGSARLGGGRTWTMAARSRHPGHHRQRRSGPAAGADDRALEAEDVIVVASPAAATSPG